MLCCIIICVKVNAFTALEDKVAKTDMLYIARYNDYYGRLLTVHQCDMIKLYYDCDISLFEIAEQFDISRQAVRDSIKRAEQLLKKYEDILGLYKKDRELQSALRTIEYKLGTDNASVIEAELDSLRTLMEDDNGDI